VAFASGTLTPPPGTLKTWTGFSTPVTLTAPACGPATYGVNTVYVHAKDQAGNTSADSTVTINFDNCDPQVVGIPSLTILDERLFESGFQTSTYAPCLYYDAGTGGISKTKAYDITAAAEPSYSAGSETDDTPDVFKYAINFTPTYPAWCIAGVDVPAGTSRSANPIAWSLTASDNRGPPTVSYYAKREGGTPGGTQTLSPTVTGVYSLPVAPGTGAGQAPGLDTTDGRYEAYVTLTDATGRTAAATIRRPLRWQHRPMGGPLKVTREALAVPASGTYVLPTSAAHSLSRDNMNELYTAGTGASANTVVAKYTIRNGTPYAVYVSVAPNAAGKYWRNIRDASEVDADIAGDNPNCSLGQAFTPATPAATTCITAPVDSDTRTPSSGTNTLAGNWITKAEAFRSGGSLAACSGGAGGCAPYEWLVGNSNSVDVYLLTNKWDFLWSAATGANEIMFIAGATTWHLFGAEQATWGTNADPGAIIRRRKRVKYLTDVSVTANVPLADRISLGTRLSPRTRTVSRPSSFAG
jgi:hypothetical protein